MTDKRTTARQAELAEQDDVHELMALGSGQRFLRRLLEEAAVFRISFVSGDPHATSFNEGRRNLGLWLAAQLTPEELATLLKET